MHTHVYANSQEIACKAAGSDGVSPAAFPDPCWSPPAPSAGPIVIPYPNTCEATNITNGTSTVFICGKQVAIEDQSYFSTSTGNEGATQAFSKGVATGVIRGKAYFTQWSSDVIFEGFGVPRNNDLVSHNHGSFPSNTPVFPYIARSIIWDHVCDDEERRINRACEAEKDQSDARSEVKKQSTLSRLLRAQRGQGSKKGSRDRSGWHWTDDHCDGLGAMLESYGAAREYANKLQETFKSLPSELELFKALQGVFTDMAINAGTHAAMKWGAKALVKQGLGSSVPGWGNAVMALTSVVDGAIAIGDVSEIRAVAAESLERLDVLSKKASELQNLANRFGNISGLTDKEVLQLATQGQDMLATLNDCTRARKCNLVPYGGDAPGNLIKQRNNSRVESASGGGCCPGQTGHHLIPEASLKAQCPSYDHNMAPTVCVEGFSQNHGSHQRAHQALAEQHRQLARSGRVSADGSMSMDDAIDAAADSHKDAFPLSNCSTACIKEQLENYYKMCNGARPRMVDEQAKKVTPPVRPTRM